MLSWLFGTHHVSSFSELFSLLGQLGTSFLFVAMTWVLYVALEPFVRRRWPQTIISWTRMLAGKLRDPVVGGHVLAGVVFGVVLAASVHIIELIGIQTTGVPTRSVLLDTMVSVPRVAAILLGIPAGSLLSTLGIFFIFFLLRTLLRREWIAAVVFVLLLTIFATIFSQTSVVVLPIRLAQYTLIMFIMLRFGLLPFVVGQAVASILISFPITTEFSAWYAGSAIFALAFTLVLAGWAFHTALGGRPLFKEALLET